MDKPLIYIILGSSRKGRIGARVAKYILETASKRDDANYELIDLAEWNLPYYNEPGSPMMLQMKGVAFENQKANEWAEKIAAADGFVIVTPEYNHGYPAILKNHLDYTYMGWNNKPVAFVSYSMGPFMGLRVVEQLRLVVAELQMASIRESVAFGSAHEAFDENGVAKEDHSGHVNRMLDQLMWWTKTLKAGRQEKAG